MAEPSPSPSPPTSPFNVDETKIQARDPEMGAKWRAMSGWNRLRFVTAMLRLVTFKILPQALLGIAAGPQQSVTLETVLPGCVWQAYSEHKGIPGSMTVVSLGNGVVVLYNVVRPVGSLVEEVRRLGAKKIYIIVPSSSHDSFAIFWKEALPGACVLCAQSSLEKVKEVVEVAQTVEEGWAEVDATWKLGYRDNGKALNVDGELWYTLESPDGFKILLGDCGVKTSPEFKLSDALAGLAPWTSGPSARMNTAWGARVLTDPQAYRNTLRELADSGNWVVWAGLHGRALTSNIKNALLTAAGSV